MRLCALAVCAAAVLRGSPADISVDDKIDKLTPVMEKLKGLDGKTYNLLNNLLTAAGKGHVALVQTPNNWVDEKLVPQLRCGRMLSRSCDKLAALGPVLVKLQHLDGKTFKTLSAMINQAEASKPSLLQDPVDMGDKLARLQPVLEKLRAIDGKAFGVLNNLIDQAQSQQLGIAAVSK